MPALVPLTFEEKELEFCKSLAGLSLNASVKINKTVFNEGLIFTHRGISGPSILQISSYWEIKQPISINLLPELNMGLILKERRNANPKQNLSNILSDYLPNRLALAICNKLSGLVVPIPTLPLARIVILLSGPVVLPVAKVRSPLTQLVSAPPAVFIP